MKAVLEALGMGPVAGDPPAGAVEVQQRLERAQRQLLQTEKLAAIGQLAAGIAHEINNPIGYVLSNIGTLTGYVNDLIRLIRAHEGGRASPQELKVLRDQIDLDFLVEDIVALIAESQDGIERVKHIVASLKDFSRSDEGGPAAWADIHVCIDRALAMCQNELKYKARVQRAFGELPKVMCRASQIGQVLVNLLVNAAQAIDEQGVITVATGVEAGGVRIDVGDTGRGIEPAHLDRVFDPFFTTKPVGQGTGLGLSLSYGIIKDHGGWIKVESVLGQGSRFSVWLPLTPSAGTGV